MRNSMGKRGPRPEPTKLRIVKGNPGKRPLPEGEPEVEIGLPAPPKDLCKAAKDEWNRMAPLVEMWCAEIDLATFHSYCAAVAEVRRLEKIVWKEGHAVEGSTGSMVRNPNSAAYLACIDKQTKLAAELGFTPSSRTKVKTIKKSPKEDPYKEFSGSS